MELVAYDKEKLPSLRSHGWKKSENLLLLEKFIDSGLDCMKVEGWKHKNARVCSSSLANSIKRYKINGVRAFTLKDEVFLIKV